VSDLICVLMDDEPSIRTFMRSILERESFQCLEADHAQQALRLLRKLGGRVDLVISDIEMPGAMSGVDLAYAMRIEFESLPLLLISGSAGADVLDRTGPAKFLRKPFLPEQLLATLTEMLATFECTTNHPGE
jgi:DNA-binding NtrC family response regulator